MPDYIFNDGNRPVNNNFSTGPDRTVLNPIEPKFKEAKSSLSTKLVAWLCVGAIALGGLAGYGGAMLATGGSDITEEPAVIYRDVQTIVPTDASLTYTGVTETVENCVVEIVTQYQAVSSFFQYVTGGAGSGVIMTEDGYIITNTHVIVDDNGKAVSDITVTLKNGEKYPATVVGADAETDIAVLKIEASGLSYAVTRRAEDPLAVGEEVLAVGNPLGELGGTITNGIISALDREIEVDGNTMNLLQTNAAINPGNSGGGLFDMMGRLVGIVNAKSSGTGIEGLGFAIPVEDALSVFEQLVSYGYVRGRTYMGVSLLEINDVMTAYKYGVKDFGVYVYQVVTTYNDDVLKPGDRILGVDGTDISTVAQLKSIIREHQVGDTLTFTIARNNEITDVTVTLFEATPENTTEINFSDT
ncbi:MAG: trypsin-like peptidase domain-containing protein [Clostridia bacterium]|nr:trypsin-like peptidase domain-containing protein [Clostridia bacterium]